MKIKDLNNKYDMHQKNQSHMIRVSHVADLITNNLDLKHLYYSDLRVSPNYITGIKERSCKVVYRRRDFKNHPHINELIDACFAFEKRIQSNVMIVLSTIASNSMRTAKPTLKNIGI